MMAEVMRLKDVYGRFMGTIKEFWIDEDESYRDVKVHNVRFPKHDHTKPSEVKVYHISEINKN